MEVQQLIAEFGFPLVMAVGMGYFVYFVYQTIMLKVNPAILQMKTTIMVVSTLIADGNILNV